MKNFNLTIEFILGQLPHTCQTTQEGNLILVCDNNGYNWVKEALNQSEIKFEEDDDDLIDDYIAFTFKLDDIKEVAPNMWKDLYDLKEKNKANGYL